MRKGLLFCVSVAVGLGTCGAWAREPLTFEERVKAQEAIERVYYEHRSWPRDNPQAKPSFEKAVPRTLIEEKVRDTLKKCWALDQMWQRPITPEQIQSEIDRIGLSTKDPAMLQEIFRALNMDPYLIGECLARPVLADRLSRSWYSNDARFHSGERQQAILASASLSWDSFEGEAGAHQSVQIIESGDGAASAGELGLPDRPGTVVVSSSEFARLSELMPPEGCVSSVRETDDAFVVSRTLQKARQQIKVESLSFPKRPLETWVKGLPLPTDFQVDSSECPTWKVPNVPSASCTGGWADLALNRMPDARGGHTAVWTGTEMIVWGGLNTLSFLELGTGGRYNPTTDSWLPTSNSSGAPSARAYHTAVWTGTEMIIWGGRTATSPYQVNTGGRYNPTNDTWTDTSTGTNVPTARDYHSAVWTGSEMIIWGGEDPYACWTGGRYNPTTNSWTPTSNSVSKQSLSHTAVWTGTEMIVWGGLDWSGAATNTGARYNPTTDTWTATSEGTNLPGARERHTAVWTGSVMIVWGGTSGSTLYLNTGGRYNPTTNAWTSTSTGNNVPTGRRNHSAVWTGSLMIVWGGEDISHWGTQTGGRYNPSNNTWTQVSTGSNLPAGRTYHTAVWTGTEMIVWGGHDEANYAVQTGGRYSPSSNSWVPTSTGAYVPSKRGEHTAVWTGTEMIIWGGRDQPLDSPLGTGGRYTPALDTWSPTSIGTGVPSARIGHTAVWTGSEMVVWGGEGYSIKTNTGGRYSPSGDSWSAVSISGACPVARANHTAVWTGTEMIIWGGDVNSGGRYSPTSNSWAATSTGANCPTARRDHTAVWTGSEMIVWGGYGGGYLSTGARYTPASDTWMATSVGSNVPDARDAHTALWSGTEMIIWGGRYSYSGYTYLASGGRYSPQGDSWTATSVQEPCPSARASHTAVWTGSEMVIWGGNDTTRYYQTGARFSPGENRWTAVATDRGVPSGNSLHTAVWTGSQMVVWGGYGQGVTASGGVYSPLWMSPPTVSGASTNSCPATVVALSASGSYPLYQWNLNGNPLIGATGISYSATLSGNYSVSVSDTNGCQATSPAKAVTVTFCAQSEVSPASAPFPARLQRDGGSSTGYYLYFQKMAGATGYNIYEGSIGGWYTHSGATGNRCNASTVDLGTGEMRAEITPSAGNRYYLVTAFNTTSEGPSGYDSSGAEIPPSYSTCGT